MNAKEAREKAVSVNNTKDSAQYGEIKRRIDAATNNGDFEITHYENLRPNVRKTLETEGYHVSSPTSCGNNEQCIDITW